MTAPTAPATREDERLVQALRNGDEQAFARLVERYHSSLVRLAMGYVRSRAVAEEVAQETWLGVLKGIDRFEGRSSLRTWIFRIMENTARTRGERESLTIPFSALAGEDESEPAVEAERFLDPGSPRWAGHWASPPTRWDAVPDERLLSKETLGRVRAAIETLPVGQRQVITLRDVEGWPADEVCDLLGVSEVNQRVLLHRARSKVRNALEEYLAEA